MRIRELQIYFMLTPHNVYYSYESYSIRYGIT